MSWSEIFLGVIAVATLVMALLQVGAIVAVSRVARDAQKTLTSVQEDVRPLVARVNALAEEASRALTSVQDDIRPLVGRVSAIAEEASKTATLATGQAEKIDRLVTDLTRRIDETSLMVQKAIITPAREGIAIVAAIRATFSALRGFRDMGPRPGRGAEEEDPLFIG